LAIRISIDQGILPHSGSGAGADARRSAAINGISAEGWVSQNGEHGMARHSTPAAVQRAGSCLPARR